MMNMTNEEFKKYHEKHQKIRREAIEKIISIVATLTRSDWSRIVALITQHYEFVAAKVVLDDDSLKNLEKNLKCELQLETYSGKPIE